VPTAAQQVTLRQCALAVSVLGDVDLLPHEDGALIIPAHPASPAPAEPAPAEPAPVLVGWAELAETVGPHDPLSDAGRARVTGLLRLYRTVAEHGTQTDHAAPEVIGERIRLAARALALPPDHALHPGRGWVLGELRGGALDLGVGVLGLGQHPDDVRPLPPTLARRLGLRPDGWWPDLADHLERMGELVSGRIERDGRAVLRPVGGCDALTLLAAASLRENLAGGDGTGLRAVAVPTRRLGWFDLARIDPAYTAAAWSIADQTDRGLPTPVLVTRDEVVLPTPGGDVVAASLGRNG
jgi:hypothetical protein